MAKGMAIFPSVQAAINAGYQVVDSHYEIEGGRYGMLVRIKTAAGWALGLVSPQDRDEVA